MAKLTEDMKHMITRLRLCFAATVTPDGKPNLSRAAELLGWDRATLRSKLGT